MAINGAIQGENIIITERSHFHETHSLLQAKERVPFAPHDPEENFLSTDYYTGYRTKSSGNNTHPENR